MNNPLLSLLASIESQPRSSGHEIRAKLGLDRSTYQDQIEHLTRMGYLASDRTDGTCSSGGCDGCAIGCQSTPETGPRTLLLTAKGHRFLERSHGSPG